MIEGQGRGTGQGWGLRSGTGLGSRLKFGGGSRSGVKFSPSREVMVGVNVLEPESQSGLVGGGGVEMKRKCS